MSIRSTRRSLAAAALMFVTACSTERAAVGSDLTGPSRPSTAVAGALATAACSLTEADLVNLANTAFGPGSPNVNSVIGKIGSLAQQVAAGSTAEAKGKAFEINEFVLRKHRQEPLPGGNDAVTALVNGVFCFAGLPYAIDDPSNAWFILPTDAAQVVINNTGLAGVSLPASPVSEPTLLTIAPIPFVGPPGAGPLTTKLDQYPGYFFIEKFSATDAPLLTDVVVGICPTGNIPADVRARLRLGHDREVDGFELTPPADAGFLDCATALARSTPPEGIFSRLASFFTPKPAYASASAIFGGGVGGTVRELSPFGPVDEMVSFSGGVGGTVRELIRTDRREIAFQMLNSCPSVEAPIGTALPTECRPGVRLRTPLGTPMVNVPVTFTVQSGGGQIAVQSPSGSCGTFGSSASGVTEDTGALSFCWIMGTTPGANSVLASAAIGGDIPATAAITPSTVTFSATANPPVGFSFAPAPPASLTAGAQFSVGASAVDYRGVVVEGYVGNVALSITGGTFAGGATSVNTAASAGVAGFGPLSITGAGSYTLTATGTFGAGTFSTTTASFSITPAAASVLTKVAGDLQSAAAGSTLPIAPTVRVTDVYGNPIAGQPIAWAAGGASGSAVNPAVSSTVTNGQASTSWTVGAGANDLSAMFVRAAGDTAMVLFSATGTTAALTTFNECAPGNSGDPFNDPSKPFAFYIPEIGNNKVIRQVTMWVSSAGKANMPSAYQLRLTVRRNSFDPSLPNFTQSSVAPVLLRGNNSENKAVTFTFDPAIADAAGNNTLTMRLEALTNPDGAKLSFNTGACAPGTSCRPVSSCKATEVSSPLPYPLGTLYRKTVGIQVRGN